MDKIIFIICDGLSDRPVPELKGKTPLEAAFTPNLDKMAKGGVIGLIHTIDKGIRPGSDVAHLSLFGYNPKIYYTGRGIFEALGIGADVKPNDIALRGNFATIDEDMNIIDRRAQRVDHTENLIEALQKIKIAQVKIFIKKGTGHRAAVVLRGKNLSAHVTDVDPHHTDTKVTKSIPIKKNPKAQHTANIINEFTKKSYEVLRNHPFNIRRKKDGLLPANILLLRGASKMVDIPNFEKKYNLKAACIAGAGLYKGIAKALGMTIIPISGATGKPDSQIENKTKMAKKILKEYDFIFIHIKGADSLAEDGNFLGKKKFIEKIDQAMSQLKNIKNTLIVVTSDHTTSSKLKIHTADPVPVLITGQNIHTDDVTKFSERTAYQGRLGHLRGVDLMPILVDYLGKAPLYGA